MILNQIENDFIDFMSQKRGRPQKEIEDIFITTKDRFEFSGMKYRELCDSMQYLCRILYDDVDEKELIDSYKFHALPHLYRFISYSYPYKSSQPKNISLSRRIKSKLYSLVKGKKQNQPKDSSHMNTVAIPKLLVENINSHPVVVDYGCGLGYISFEIGKVDRNSKIYLIDIDCLTLEFAEFRFKKHGIDVETIPITKNDVYPKLPAHNICIATEVMEHVLHPLIVYQNIYSSLDNGGLLYGDFEDHLEEIFHVSPNLRDIRKRMDIDFQKISTMLYKKIQ